MSIFRLKSVAAASLLQPSSKTNSAKNTENDRRMPKIMQSESELTMTMRAVSRNGSSRCLSISHVLWVLNKGIVA